VVDGQHGETRRGYGQVDQAQLRAAVRIAQRSGLASWVVLILTSSGYNWQVRRDSDPQAIPRQSRCSASLEERGNIA
jgi:hypothetical protein